MWYKFKYKRFSRYINLNTLAFKENNPKEPFVTELPTGFVPFECHFSKAKYVYGPTKRIFSVDMFKTLESLGVLVQIEKEMEEEEQIVIPEPKLRSCRKCGDKTINYFHCQRCHYFLERRVGEQFNIAKDIAKFDLKKIDPNYDPDMHLKLTFNSQYRNYLYEHAQKLEQLERELL